MNVTLLTDWLAARLEGCVSVIGVAQTLATASESRLKIAWEDLGPTSMAEVMLEGS